MEKNLQARVRVLVDAHHLVERLRARPTTFDIDTQVDWMSARDGLQQAKWYRQHLSEFLASSGNQAAEDQMQSCLDMVAKAWPDLRSIKAPSASSKGKKGKGKGKSRRRESQP